MYGKKINLREKLGKCQENFENGKFDHQTPRQTIINQKSAKKNEKKKLLVVRLEPATWGL